MKYILLICCLILTSAAHEGEYKGAAYSAESMLHREIHNSEETYLICIYEHKKSKYMKDFEKLNLKATIVSVVKGDKKVGDKIEYVRTYDGKFGDLSGLNGSLYYVHFTKYDGIVEINPQDPASVVGYSNRFRLVVDAHRKAPQHDYASVTLETLRNTKKLLLEIKDKPSAKEQFYTLATNVEELNHIVVILGKQKQLSLESRKKFSPEFVTLTQEIATQLKRISLFLNQLKEDDPEPMMIQGPQIAESITRASKMILKHYAK